ncbi:hypothetical protein JCM19239_5801 [Vibrio variabilis]|uniref:Uncharacterized protein n=1 Tax=Vibrio variabilis TaxID=990271 RepID=A0ABQ0J876_9VIBR|nr:hypothetical protein JCM19239_5801 [Vibrio variabilis]
MDGALLNALTGLLNDINPFISLVAAYLYLKAARTLNEHDKRISKLEWKDESNG